MASRINCAQSLLWIELYFKQAKKKGGTLKKNQSRKIDKKNPFKTKEKL